MESEGRINFISCVKWVEKGKARTDPVKIKISRQELVEMIKNTHEELNIRGHDEEGENQQNSDINMELNDGEDEHDILPSIASLRELSTDPQDYLSDTDDSEKEDDLIKQNDNLVLIGRFDGDACILEVHVYNEDEVSLYCHHDFLLPSFPVCFEWLNYEPNCPQGNYCAVGTMEPIIEIYNLDIINTIKPAFKLGQKAHRKKGRAQVGHKSSVLSLAWNRTYDHVMASGSADNSIILWDLEKKEPSTTINEFEGGVQCLDWHKVETQSLLAGGCDSQVKLFDCNSPDSHLTWKLDGECETLSWHPLQPFTFMAGTSVGTLQCFDCRKGPLWSLSAHEKEVSGIFISGECPGLLVTGSHDGMVKTWDYSGENVPELVHVKDFNMGTILSLEGSPNSPFVIAAGGDNKENNFTLYDLRNIDVGKILLQRCRSRIKKYCETTSLHGFHYITDLHSNILQTILWVILCFAATAFTVFLISMQWDRYQTHRISTAIGSIMYPLENVPFPGLTLCSSNIVFGAQYKKFEHMLLNDGLSKAQIIDYFENLSSLVIHDELASNADWKTYGRIIQALDLSDYNVERVMSEVAEPCELLITNCSWKSRKTNCTQIFTKTKTQSGFCCSLDLKNDTISGVGPKFGLQLDVDVVEEEYISAIKPYYGLDVTLHQKDVYPETKYFGTAVAMGVDVQISVIPEVVRATDELRNMDISLRECLFEDESTLRWNYVYSLSGCKSQCEADKIRKLCKCIPYYYPVEENERICTLLDLRCMRDVLYNKMAEQSCDCLPPCNKLSYKYNVNAREVKTIIGYDDSIQGSRITIYFGDDQCVMIERSANLTWDALLASIGGVIGLCLGGSVLSIIEFIYFFIKSLLCKFDGTEKKTKKKELVTASWNPKLYITDFKPSN